MALDTWLIYFLAATGLSLSPGPNGLLALTHGALHGRRKALYTIFGGAVGFVAVIALSLFGIGALLATSLLWLAVMKWVGGAYLVWLGIQAWRARPEHLNPAAAEAVDGATSLLRGLRVGFLTEITNPKGIAFFLGLFAAAVPDSTPLWAKLVVLSAGGVIELAWYTAVAFVLSSGPMLAGYQRVRRTVDRVLGTLLIVLGLKVALDAR